MKPPSNLNHLQRLLNQAAREQQIPVKRLMRWVGYMVLAGMLERAVSDEDHQPLFLAKGGVAMELHLHLMARATADFDTAFRGSSARIEEHLDAALSVDFLGFSAKRSKAEHVRDTGMQRFQVKLSYLGKSFSTVQLEVAEAEASIGTQIDMVQAKSLGMVNIVGPDSVACLPVRWIIAQKLHACTEVLAERDNDRFRDLLDLLLLEGLIGDAEWPAVRAACVALFDGRGRHTWPPTVTMFPGWEFGYQTLATDVGFEITSAYEAADGVRSLIARIDQST